MTFNLFIPRSYFNNSNKSFDDKKSRYFVYFVFVKSYKDQNNLLKLKKLTQV